MKRVTTSLVALIAINSALVSANIEKLSDADIIVVDEKDLQKSGINNTTTVKGDGALHYRSHDRSADLFEGENSTAAAAVTLDVTHRINKNFAANFVMVGYTDFGNEVGVNKFEQTKAGAILNLANLEATYGTTKFIAGRQLLDSPMAGSYNRFLAPSAFEAYTIVNNSVDNLTLVGSYVDKVRGNNTGSKFVYLNGDNYTMGAAYKGNFSANIWLYNVDAGKYQQVYTDAGYKINGVKVEGQLIATDYDTGNDSTSYGLKVSGKVENFDLSAAYARVLDRQVGMIEVDSIYTSSHNIWASQLVDQSFKVEAGTTIDDITAKISYADYDQAKELDVTFGYKMSNQLSVDAVYTTTEYAPDTTKEGALELVSRYKF